MKRGLAQTKTTSRWDAEAKKSWRWTTSWHAKLCPWGSPNYRGKPWWGSMWSSWPWSCWSTSPTTASVWSTTSSGARLALSSLRRYPLPTRVKGKWKTSLPQFLKLIFSSLQGLQGHSLPLQPSWLRGDPGCSKGERERTEEHSVRDHRKGLRNANWKPSTWS